MLNENDIHLLMQARHADPFGVLGMHHHAHGVGVHVLLPDAARVSLVRKSDGQVVGELQRVANLRHDGQRFVRRNAVALHELAQVHAVHVFHQEVVKAVG